METTTKQVVTLDQIKVRSLPELQGWKEKQKQIVKDNPFIKIEDNKTYDEAKKNRTALVSARTDIQKQDKLIASKIKELRTQASEAAKELISITQPHEEKQQEEVKRYEAEKEAERKEKERIEQERKDAIQKSITDFYTRWKNAISEMNFSNINSTSVKLDEAIVAESEKEMEEFEMDFAEKTNLLNDQLEERVQYLTEQEEARKERERLAEERKQFEAQKQKEEEARKAREEEERKKREAEEAERKAKEEKERKAREEEENKIRAEREAEAEKIRKEREELEAEKRKIEAERKAKEEAELKAKQKAEEKAREEAEAKRLKELQPEKDKLKSYINSLNLSDDAPEVKDESLLEVLERFENELKTFKQNFLNEVEATA